MPRSDDREPIDIVAKEQSSSERIYRRLNMAIGGTRGLFQDPFGRTGQARLRRIDAGQIVLPTGRICVTDALSADEFPPLNVMVVPGEYRVEIVLAQPPKRLGSARGAFIVVRFSKEPLEVWQPITAVSPADPCFTDEMPNAMVQEGGIGIFSFESAAAHLARRRRDRRFVNQILSRSKAEGNCEWLNFRPGRSKENAIFCAGGLGDGTCFCAGGFAKTGRLACLVVDYAFMDAI